MTLSKAARALPASAALTVDLKQKALKAAGRDIISFGVGEPDFPAPEIAAKADKIAVGRGDTKYTSVAGTPDLRRAAAASLKRDYGLDYTAEEIVVTPGSKFAFHAAILALLDPGDSLILPAPYYTSYFHSAQLCGVVPKTVFCGAESGFKLTPKQLDAAAGGGARALCLVNPGNPSGAVYTKKELLALYEVIKARDLMVIADEIYGRLVYGPEPFCAFASLSADAKERTVTINGVSKTYSMTGFRIGFAAAARETASAMTAILSHTVGSANAPAQAAATAALMGGQEEVLCMREAFRARRELMIAELSKIPGLGFSVPDGAFYTMLDVRPYRSPACPDDAAFALMLLEALGVAAVPCSDYGAPGYIRLSFTLGESLIREGVRRINLFLQEEGWK